MRASLLLVLACSDPAPKQAAAVTKVEADAAPAADAGGPLAPSWLGIRLDPDLIIVQVLAGTPAEKAGLVAGDRVLTLYGAPLHSARHLVDQIQRIGSGATVPLVVARGADELKVSITLEQRPPDRFEP